MRTAFLLGMIYLALIAQTTLAPQVAFGEVSLRFVPLAVYLVLTCSPPGSGMVLVSALGLAADCISPGPLGAESVACVLLAAVLYRWQMRGSLRHLAVAGWLMPLSLAIETGLVTATRLWWADREIVVRALAEFSGTSALSTTLIGLLLLRLPAVTSAGTVASPRSHAAV